MPRKKSHEEFVDEIKIKHPNIHILGKYETSKSKILCKCKIDGYVWETIPNVLLRGHGCPKCSKCNRKSTEDFKIEMENKNPNIEIIGEYINSKEKIKCKCKICKEIWEVTPNHLLKGSGCPVCSQQIHRNTKKTTLEFITEMYEVNPNIKICGEYKTSHSKILCRCLRDGFEWKAKPMSLLSGYGCPKCSFPKGELSIEKYLHKYDIKYEAQKKFDGLIGVLNGSLSYDFYIPSLNSLIEYNGKQHYVPIEWFGGTKKFEQQQEHDKRKREYAKQNNIKLIEIPYWDFENIEEILSKELGLVA